MSKPIGVHHLAVMTGDMKGQLEFFTQVLGAPLVGIFDMHGVPGAWHSFVRLDDTTYLSFVQMPGVGDVPSTVGVTHAGTGAGISAAGTLQHLAFQVADEDGLLGLRDRLRSAGHVVLGPIDHGLCRSVYFAGPEGLVLEAAWSADPLDAALWVDPDVAGRAGISAEDLERYCRPAGYERPAEPVAQPAIDPAKPRLGYPDDEYEFMVALPDDVVTRTASMPDPPVPASASSR